MMRKTATAQIMITNRKFFGFLFFSMNNTAQRIREAAHTHIIAGSLYDPGSVRVADEGGAEERESVDDGATEGTVWRGVVSTSGEESASSQTETPFSRLMSARSAWLAAEKLNPPPTE
ncbi:MAG: hypothetical protein IJV00_01950 [Clostridia bacterium]|nr:hypothetical protein [Clostridia bacterium]